ncbi:hypothetical protein [Bacillus fonticola]|uniref:hypothetical protein n=1 Tax=Bacillus fonticola TaxID=2728853 RepID=UPI001474C0BC|nr:hypothetical protein [Bacillus fonticola]
MEKKKASFLPDTPNNGREDHYVDVDRFFNEGFAIGKIHLLREDNRGEEHFDLPPEEPPNHS